VLGKKINFDATVYNWNTGSPVEKPISIEATIVGVVDTSTTYEYNSQIMKVTVDDSFFFSKSAIDEIRKQGDLGRGEGNFTIRAKNPEGLISLKDELNKQGIVPLGKFELVEDIVRLNNKTTEQSGSANLIISILSVIIVVSIVFIRAFMRRREYAIYKLSGYNNSHLKLISFGEMVSVVSASMILFLLASPLINNVTTMLFNVNILNFKMLLVGCILIILLGLLSFLIVLGVLKTVNILNALKTGDR
ncbi:MAG: macrolide ABC transporter ATP-binding protein/permease, partial [Clostridium sp.]